jgi:hypothetical protein
MRAQAVKIAVLVLCIATAAAAREESVESLKAKAQREGHPRLYAEVVRLQVEVANDYYTSGELEKAQDVISEIVTLAEKVVETAQKNPRSLKATELTLSKAGRRLEDVRRSLAFDDQPPVKTAVSAIEKARRNLLDLMFQDPDKKKKADEAAPVEESKE